MCAAKGCTPGTLLLFWGLTWPGFCWEWCSGGRAGSCGYASVGAGAGVPVRVQFMTCPQLDQPANCNERAVAWYVTWLRLPRTGKCSGEVSVVSPAAPTQCVIRSTCACCVRFRSGTSVVQHLGHVLGLGMGKPAHTVHGLPAYLPFLLVLHSCSLALRRQCQWLAVVAPEDRMEHRLVRAGEEATNCLLGCVLAACCTSIAIITND